MLLIMTMVFSFGPASVFAGNETDKETLKVSVQEDGSVSVKGFESDDLLMQYIDHKLAEELSTDAGKALRIESAPHSRRDAIEGVAANMYDALTPSVKKVAAGELADTAITVPAEKIFDSAVYTAKDLGVKTLFDDEGNISREAFDAFVDKLKSDLSDDLSVMLSAMIADMPFELYWLDNESGIEFEFTPDWFINNMNVYNDGKAIGIETDETLQMTFLFYVSQDYSLGGSQSQYGPARTTEVDTGFTKAAAKTAENISGIIRKAADEPDVHKLIIYKDEICGLTSYHPTAMEDKDFPYGDPWQLIYVFDGDENTKVVCEGYSKAFQYLCDNTAFNDKNIESRLIWGEMIHSSKGKVLVSGKHMWNIVHMDDGYNYIADITNCDEDENSSDGKYPGEVFLAGAVSGSVGSGYTYKYENGTIKYIYDTDMHSIFSKNELTMSNNSYPHDKGGDEMTVSGKTVSLKYSNLKKKNQTIAAKKAITVKNAIGSVSYKLVKVSKTSAKKKFSVAKDGKITVRKGLKKGTYKLTIAVTDKDGEKKTTGNAVVTIKVK